jgi:hypothetical protein
MFFSAARVSGMNGDIVQGYSMQAEVMGSSDTSSDTSRKMPLSLRARWRRRRAGGHAGESSFLRPRRRAAAWVLRD